MTGFWRFEQEVREVYAQWGFLREPLRERLPRQVAKLAEECGEVADAISGEETPARVADELADVMIVAIGLAVLLGPACNVEEAFFAKAALLKERSGPFMSPWKRSE